MRNVLAVLVAAIVLARARTSAAADPPPLQRELSMDLEYKPGPGTESCFSPRGMQLKLIGALTYWDRRCFDCNLRVQSMNGNL